jgi:ABC-type uncharacterized transport system involved in gliding motility auxiliary subunit
MKTLGKIAGGIGVVLLVAAPFTWYVLRSAPYATTYAGIKIALGIVLIAIWVLVGRDPGDEKAFLYYVSSGLIALLVVGIMGGVNFIASKRLKTYDWTNKKVNSLAPQTLQTLKDLKEPIKALAFVGTDNPAYEPLKELFRRYSDESDKFTYELKDPKKTVELNAKYEVKEGQTTVILTRGQGDKETHTSLNVVSEQDLTNALLKLNSSGAQKIYFLTGHAEYPLDASAAPAIPGEQDPSLSELKTSLSQEGYSVEKLDLSQVKGGIPADASMIAIVHASTPYTASESDEIEKYLEQGGRLLYFADFNAQSGLEPLLAKYGIEIAPGLVADGANPRNPYEAIALPTDHEISSILKRIGSNILMETVRGLIPLKEGTLPGITTTPVLLSSPLSWIETTPSENPEPNDNERQGAMPLAIASTRDTKAAAGKRFDEARVLVFGDSDLVINANWGNEIVRNLVLNAFAWTSTQVAKITIRPPDRDISTLDLTNDLYLKIVFFSIDAFPTLLIALGIAIYVSRKSR